MIYVLNTSSCTPHLMSSHTYRKHASDSVARSASRYGRQPYDYDEDDDSNSSDSSSDSSGNTSDTETSSDDDARQHESSWLNDGSNDNNVGSSSFGGVKKRAASRSFQNTGGESLSRPGSSANNTSSSMFQTRFGPMRTIATNNQASTIHHQASHGRGNQSSVYGSSYASTSSSFTPALRKPSNSSMLSDNGQLSNMSGLSSSNHFQNTAENSTLTTRRRRQTYLYATSSAQPSPRRSFGTTSTSSTLQHRSNSTLTPSSWYSPSANTSGRQFKRT